MRENRKCHALFVEMDDCIPDGKVFRRSCGRPGRAARAPTGFREPLMTYRTVFPGRYYDSYSIGELSGQPSLSAMILNKVYGGLKL